MVAGRRGSGGHLAARALVQRALLLPDTLQACTARLQSLRDDPLLHGERAALAAALTAVSEHTEASRGLVAVLMPALLADQSRGAVGWTGSRCCRWCG